MVYYSIQYMQKSQEINIIHLNLYPTKGNKAVLYVKVKSMEDMTFYQDMLQVIENKCCSSIPNWDKNYNQKMSLVPLTSDVISNDI